MNNQEVRDLIDSVDKVELFLRKNPDHGLSNELLNELCASCEDLANVLENML